VTQSERVARTHSRDTAADDPSVATSDERDDRDTPRERSVPATETGATPALAVEGLSKQFGTGQSSVLAVDDVSFTVERGSVVGLLGPNGAGKTTLIKSILGMVLPDTGRVEIAGIDTRESPRAAYQHVDAMLEGARNDYWRLTVRENLRYFATISGVDPDAATVRHDRLLDRLDLAEKADVPVRDLSRGMKQKVSLASVLAGGAEVVFLDEPTLGLDVESARTLQTELRRLAREEGLTVVLSSHDMDVVETVCDRVIVMSDGRIVADDTVDALRQTGDGHAIRLTSADLDPALRATLDEQFDVTTLDERDPGARIEVRADSGDLYALMATLEDSGVSIDRIETVEPALEDVFVDLTSGEQS
jgi:ABC-2 type transport system ATP-binding protein